MENEMVDACYDTPDERDWKYKDVFEEEMVGQELPSAVLLDNVEYQNQGLEKITQMMCVFYSTGHGSNEENFQEGSDVRIDNKELGLEAEKVGMLDVTKGALISAGPTVARNLGYIKGWAVVYTVEEAKASIAKKRPIVVGSNKISWGYGYRSPYVLQGDKGSAHAIVIIGFDDNYEGGCFVIKNSYGDEKYDGGKMYLPYKHFGLLFLGKFSLIDSEDPILKYKQTIMEDINIPLAKVGFELGLFNGRDSTKSITREEAVTVMVRGLEKVLNGQLTKKMLNDAIKKHS